MQTAKSALFNNTAHFLLILQEHEMYESLFIVAYCFFLSHKSFAEKNVWDNERTKQRILHQISAANANFFGQSFGRRAGNV